MYQLNVCFAEEREDVSKNFFTDDHRNIVKQYYMFMIACI